MSGVAVAIGASAVIGAYSANRAAGAASNAAGQSNDLQRYMYDQSRADQQPWMQAGGAAQNQLANWLGIGGDPNAAGYGKYSHPFTMQDYQQDPGYAFRLSEGMKGLDRTAASRGGLLSGATLKGAQRYGQDMASQEYGNAYNRFYNDRNQMLNPLQSISGQGQTSAAQVGQQGANMANQVGQNNMNAAQAQGSSYVGMANSINGGIGSYLNYQNQNNMMNMFGQQQQQNLYNNPYTNAYSTLGSGFGGAP